MTTTTAGVSGPGTELAGKVALVTGASRNIGRAIALSLAAGGAAVAVNTRASKEDAGKVVQEIRAAGGRAEVFMADIADAGAVKAMAAGILERFGRIDILVLNASVRTEKPFLARTLRRSGGNRQCGASPRRTRCKLSHGADHPGKRRPDDVLKAVIGDW